MQVQTLIALTILLCTALFMMFMQLYTDSIEDYPAECGELIDFGFKVFPYWSSVSWPAHSVATVVERRGDTALVDVRISTGRPHQIRIHLAAAGHPLTGDPLYVVGGRPRPVAPGLPGDGGYLLHAHRLQLAHPRGGVLSLDAPLPAALRSRAEATGGA